MAAPAEEESVNTLSFSSCRYSHYFTFVELKENNIKVKCKMCFGILSAFRNSNSNLIKHLQRRHPGTKLVARPPGASSDPPTDNDDGGPPRPKQQQLQLNYNLGTVSKKAQVDKAIARYVIEDMQPISTVESPAFRHLVSMIPCTDSTRQMSRKTFSDYLEKEYTKMEKKLKTAFEGLNYISTTADIWSAQNRSFLGITAHWINPSTLKHEKAALACKRFKGRHRYDVIAGEIDHIHSLYGVSTKVTSTVTDNGSNFVKAFAVYQPKSLSDNEDDDDEEVTFFDVADVLNTAADEGIVLPPHQRCASHTLNLISCHDVEKWLVSNPGTRAIYRSSTAKCTALWTKASRSTHAAEMVGDMVTTKLLVPCSTRWNSFYEAVARVVGIPMTDLSSISEKLQLKSLNDREVHFLKEYCATMKPLTEALDILQGEDNCYFGTLLPTIESLKINLLKVKDTLTVATGLPEAIVQAIDKRFAPVMESNDAMLAAITLPKFKLWWVKDKGKREMLKGLLTAECHKVFPGPGQQPATAMNTGSPTTPPDSGSSKDKEKTFFCFEEDDDATFTTVETEVLSYLKSAETKMDMLKQFPTIMEVCLKQNAATPSSAPVERLFSLGGLVLSPKRNRLSDGRFEKLLLMRYNHCFED